MKLRLVPAGHPFLGAAVMAALAGIASARSGPTFYTGFDSGAEPGDPRPNCDAADLTWTTDASSLGLVSVLDFESELLEENLFSRHFAAGISVSGNRFHIRNAPGNAPDGYNTTLGGSRYLKADGETFDEPLVYDVSFDNPVQAFSFYITGAGHTFGGSMTVRFEDGEIHSIPLANSHPLGGAQFAGFTDADRAITGVALILADSPFAGINAARLAIDDVRWVHVPAPGGAAVLAVASLALARRRR